MDHDYTLTATPLGKCAHVQASVPLLFASKDFRKIYERESCESTRILFVKACLSMNHGEKLMVTALVVENIKVVNDFRRSLTVFNNWFS